MTVRASKPAFNIREKLKELTHSIGLKGRELMRAATVQEARDLVSAGRKNMVINGDCRIAQKGIGPVSTVGGFTTHTVDRWGVGNAGSGGFATYDVTQSTDAPDGFDYSFKLETTSAATVLSDTYQRVNYSIEGYDAARIGLGESWAKKVTVSFWVKSNNPGTYSLVFNTIGSTYRFYSTLYTINQSGVWEYKTITIPGDTVSSGQNKTNDYGLYASFCLRTGSTYTASDNTNIWVNQTDGSRHYGHNTDVGNTNGDYWQITGYQVELGSNATEFEHRSYGEELALCQRYYYKHDNQRYRPSIIDGNGGYAGAFITHPVEMRAIPTVTCISFSSFYFNLSGSGSTIITPDGSTSNAYYAGDRFMGVAGITGNTNLGGTNNDQTTGQWDCRFDFSAEL